MKQARLAELIAQGEGPVVELKRQLEPNNPRSICRDIAALASGGGDIVIGVDDKKRTVVGLDHAAAEKLRPQIEGWVHKHVTPLPRLEIQILDFVDHKIGWSHLEKGPFPIYSYKNRPYVRVGSSSELATPEQVIDLVLGWHVRAAIEDIYETLGGLPHPAASVASGIMGQGELATMSYRQLKGRLIADFPILATE